MGKVTTHISAWCSIANHTARKNGETLFTGNNSDVQTFLVDVYKHLQLSYTRFYKMDNLSKLGWLATEVLLKDSFAKENYKPEDVAMVLANANSSLDSDIKYMASVADIASPALFVYTLPNIMIGEICIRNRFKGEAAFFVSDNFDAALTEQYVSNLFDRGICEACICGWVDLICDDYKAVLFLIEKGKGVEDFTAANLDEIFSN